MWLHYGRLVITMEYLRRIFGIFRFVYPLAASGGSTLQRSGTYTLEKLKDLQREVREMKDSKSCGVTLESLYIVIEGNLATDPRDHILLYQVWRIQIHTGGQGAMPDMDKRGTALNQKGESPDSDYSIFFSQGQVVE